MSELTEVLEKLEARKSKREAKGETDEVIIEKIRVANWFDRLSGQELKELCKAARLPVSGRKALLVRRLVDDITSKNLASKPVIWLEKSCQEKFLPRTGRKYELVLRLLRHARKSGRAKRVPTKMIKNPKGESIRVLKRCKAVMDPQSVYLKVEQKIQEINTNRKYDPSKFGQPRHCSDTYKLMNDLLKNNCIETSLIYTRPIEAVEIARAALKAYLHNWAYMDHSGYKRGGIDFADRHEGVMGTLETILKAAQPRLTKSRIDSMVHLLETLEDTVHGWHLEVRVSHGSSQDGGLANIDVEEDVLTFVGESNCFVDAIVVLKPSYLDRGDDTFH